MEAKDELVKILKNIHVNCFSLCKKILGSYLLVAGNIAIFCQNEDEYRVFLKAKELLTEPDDNQNRKYFHLKEPIVFEATGDIPKATYSWLYIRKPATDSPQRGDVDFVLEGVEFKELKRKVRLRKLPGAAIYDKSGWDMIELKDGEFDGLAYISTMKMAEKVRVRF